MPAYVRADMSNIQRTVDKLGQQIEQNKVNAATGGAGSETIEQLADAVANLVTQMREEQKMVRQWIQNQQVQQNEIQRLLIRQTGSSSKSRE
jgi:uncharacterized protein YggL (DUF469 family)